MYEEGKWDLSFIPKNADLHTLINKQAQVAVDAAPLFGELARKGTIDTTAVQEMRDIEHQADEACHEVIENLNKTFITPLIERTPYARQGT